MKKNQPAVNNEPPNSLSPLNRDSAPSRTTNLTVLVIRRTIQALDSKAGSR